MNNIILDEQQVRQRAKLDGVTHFSTGLMVVKNGRVLVVKRAEDDSLPGMWELPGGSVDDGETIMEGARRELLEETGLKLKNFICEFEGFDYSNSKKPKIRQINFLVETEDGDVMLDPKEHSDYKFIDLEDLDNLDCTDNQHTCIKVGFANVKP